jgi:hypothetical protein
MKSLSELAGETLAIHQPSVWKSNYELIHDEEVLGTIRSKGFFGRNIIFKMEKDEWEIYHPSIWKTEIAIRQAGYELPYATFKRKGFKSSGIVKMYKGEQLKLEYKPFQSGYNIQTISGEHLVNFKDRVSFKEKTQLHIERKSELLDKYPWVIVLAWHIMLQRKRAAQAG